MHYGQGSARNAGPHPVVDRRTVVLASANSSLRERLRQRLMDLRWQVREAGGGAEAMQQLEASGAEALLVDTWLPDLNVLEFSSLVRRLYPAMELLSTDGNSEAGSARSPRRNELLHALRTAQDSHDLLDAPVWAAASVAVPRLSAADRLAPRDERALANLELAALLRSRSSGAPLRGSVSASEEPPAQPTLQGASVPAQAAPRVELPMRLVSRTPVAPLPDLIGDSPAMRELARLVRLVAPRMATVLIEGPTGSGKELVARAVHTLSRRAARPYVVLNCAAIPETLLEAELFGHTRGAFTGAVQSRTGLVEAAHGGTLFLDEIGEMPLALQAKMLRFLECGEIQRIGGNETVRVDVRIVAATHQPLRRRAAEGTFRLDLYHRLAVFPVHIPALADRREDIPQLATALLAGLGESLPSRRLAECALEKLMLHDWPGNVRELAHVLERAHILSEERAEITADEIVFG